MSNGIHGFEVHLRSGEIFFFARPLLIEARNGRDAIRDHMLNNTIAFNVDEHVFRCSEVVWVVAQ